jgi:hypothetical protein
MGGEKTGRISRVPQVTWGNTCSTGNLSVLGVTPLTPTENRKNPLSGSENCLKKPEPEPCLAPLKLRSYETFMEKTLVPSP